MQINRHFPNLLSDDLNATASFFIRVLGFQTEFQSDWFIHLNQESNKSVELGILPRRSQIVPKGFQTSSSSTVLTYTKVFNLALK